MKNTSLIWSNLAVYKYNIFKLMISFFCFSVILGGCTPFSNGNETLSYEDSNRVLYFDQVNMALYEMVDQKEVFICSNAICEERMYVMQQYMLEQGQGVWTKAGFGYRLGSSEIYFYIKGSETGYSIYEIRPNDNMDMSQLRYYIEQIVLEEGYMSAITNEDKSKMMSTLCITMVDNGILECQEVLDFCGFSSNEIAHAEVIFEAIKECYSLIDQVELTQ